MLFGRMHRYGLRSRKGDGSPVQGHLPFAVPARGAARHVSLGDDLACLNKNGLICPVIHLKFNAVGVFNHGTNRRVDNVAKRQADLYAVADLELPWVGLLFFSTARLYDIAKFDGWSLRFRTSKIAAWKGSSNAPLRVVRIAGKLDTTLVAPINDAARWPAESDVAAQSKAQSERMTGRNAHHAMERAGLAKNASAAMVRVGYSSAGKRECDD